MLLSSCSFAKWGSGRKIILGCKSIQKSRKHKTFGWIFSTLLRLWGCLTANTVLFSQIIVAYPKYAVQSLARLLPTVWGLDLAVIGYVVQERIALSFIVHVAAIVLSAVGDYEIVHVKQEIVSRNLVEYALRDSNVGSLVFNNHLRL